MREKGRRRERTGESKNERKREKEESSEDVRERTGKEMFFKREEAIDLRPERGSKIKMKKK